MIDAFLNYAFIRNAVFALILSSIVCALIGVIISEKKMIMLTGSVAHTAYGGVGLGFLIGVNPLLTAMLFAVLSALIIGYFKSRGGKKSDELIALLWSFGMALGILFVYFTKGYPPDMQTYLFGNVLTVTKSDLILMAVLTLIVAFVIIMLFSDCKALLFDEQFLTLRGVKTKLLNYIILVLISLSVVVLIKSVGIILSLALLSAPSAASALFAKRLWARMTLSFVFSLIITLSGLALSHFLLLPASAVIAIIAATFYALSLIIAKIKK